MTFYRKEVALPGEAARDVIGTLAVRASMQGYRVLISTDHEDMAQLVTENINLENSYFGTQLDPKGVIAKFRVPPESIVAFLALVGNPIDSIPGVPKVRPRTAANWLRKHGSLEALVENAAKIRGAVGENFRASLEQIAVSRKIETIRCDLPLPLSLENLVRRIGPHVSAGSLEAAGNKNLSAG